MKILNRLLPFLKNKYVIASVSFVIWVAFFDVNNSISQLEFRDKLNDLLQTKKYYETEIKKHHTEIEELSINEDTLIDPSRIKLLERFAREKYLMKKDDEDIFVIETQYNNDTIKQELPKE